VKAKVLVLGSTGLIGHQVYNCLIKNKEYVVFNFSYRKKLTPDSYLIDASNLALFEDQITKIKPNFIVNCIGILINESIKNPANAIFLNAYLPHKLRNIADKINAKLIHMSTDCVFSGNQNNSYTENDSKDGQGIYSLSKNLGEVLNDRHLTLRTSVVGPELKENGEELFNWFMSQSGKVFGFNHAIWSGVTTLELAKAVNWSIKNNITGIYHVTNNIPISKSDLLGLFIKHTKKDITMIESDQVISNKSFVDTRKLIDYDIPEYDDMISAMVDDILKNKSLYNHYQINKIK
jgi:dTDP-4-dehydrorhamnose reductase